MADEPMQKFFNELVGDVEEGVCEDMPFSQEVFTNLVLERLEEAGHLEGTFPLHQEGRIKNAAYRIDGYAYDEERSRLDLFTTIYGSDSEPAKLPAADVTKALERALRFASACIDGLAASLEPANTDASDLARLIENEGPSLKTIRVIVLTDGIVGNITPPEEWRGKPVEFETYDLPRLYRVLGEGETRGDINVDLSVYAGGPVPCLHVPSQDGSYDAYLAVLPGEALSRFYERYGVRLLELNVRAFLGLLGRKSVNSELQRTIKDQPSMFLAFNNGIVATVDDLELDTSERGVVKINALKGLQIVNGGQTTAVLHKARRKEGLPLDDVSVPVKIIKVGGAELAEMVSSISRAANRQNTVQLADFSANDPFHQAIETLANNTWLDDGKGRWFYERARGSYTAAEQKAAYRKTDQQAFRAQTPKNRRLSKLDVARYLSAWQGMPYRVCLGGQKNFQHFMQRLKDEPPPPPDTGWFKRLIAIAVLYRATEKKARAMKFPAYGAQIIAYLVSSLAQRTGGRIDFDMLWSKQAISPELENLIANWATEIDASLRKSAGQRNPSEWFKKEDCWKEMQVAIPALSDPLPPELSYANRADSPARNMIPVGSHSVADYERIAKCMEIESGVWLEVAEKGSQRGIVHWKVAGICRTMATYAAGGWQRKPSIKQAKPALKAVLAASREGLIQIDPTFASLASD